MGCSDSKTIETKNELTGNNKKDNEIKYDKKTQESIINENLEETEKKILKGFDVKEENNVEKNEEKNEGNNEEKNEENNTEEKNEGNNEEYNEENNEEKNEENNEEKNEGSNEENNEENDLEKKEKNDEEKNEGRNKENNEEKRIKEKKEEEERETKNLLPYRIDYFSFPSSRPITSIKCFCPHCAEIPNISLGYKNESGNYVKCDQCRYCYCCSNPKIKTLDDYISLMVKVHKDYFCEVHDKKEEKQKGYFSCELCQKWMCEKCINEHITKNKQHYYYIIRIPYEENIHTNCAKHNFKEYEYFIADEDFMCGYHICEDCEFDYENNYGNDIYHLNKELGVCCVNQIKDLIEIGVVYLDDYCKKLYDRLIKSIGKDENLINKAKELYKKFIIRNRRVLFFLCFNQKYF